MRKDGLVSLCSLWLVACSSAAPPADVLPPADHPTPRNDARLDATANDAPIRGPFPIILAHGFFGFDNIGPLQYFYQVKPALEQRGHAVFVSTVDPLNSSYERGPQLLKQVQAALAESGAAKVNIIGHSQGGLDARFVAAAIPERIGAVVTIATPHRGTPLADIMVDKAPGFTVSLMESLFRALFRPVLGEVAQDADLQASLEFLTTHSVASFNTKVPDDPTVSYFSIGGRSNSALAEAACAADGAPAFITRYATHTDPIEPLLLLTAQSFGSAANDGIVAVSSMKWGRWLGCVPADHFDQVGQLAGDRPGGNNPFDYLAMYVDLAEFLVARGF